MPYVVERKPLTLLERVYIPQILAGMKVTLKHLFAPNVTMEYPEVRPPIPTGYRGVPTLVKDPNGREKCVSCQLCEFVCPPKAIRITMTFFGAILVPSDASFWRCSPVTVLAGVASLWPAPIELGMCENGG